MLGAQLAHGLGDPSDLATIIAAAAEGLPQRSLLLDELRKELALYYVGRTDQSLEQVAARLGFTEPSTFYRAFKRWEGTTPAVYRARK